MDIIKEYGQGEDEDFDECSNDDNDEEDYDLGGDGAYSEKRVSNRLNETKEVDDDASKPSKAAKMSKLRKKRTMKVQRQIKKIDSSTSLKASKN